MDDPETGTLIGEQTAEVLSGWRIDDDHTNWWNWSGGREGRGGRFGHTFIPAGQKGQFPHSKHIGYAEGVP
jgi:hypothetical protein